MKKYLLAYVNVIGSVMLSVDIASDVCASPHKHVLRVCFFCMLRVQQASHSCEICIGGSLYGVVGMSVSVAMLTVLFVCDCASPSVDVGM